MDVVELHHVPVNVKPWTLKHKTWMSLLHVILLEEGCIKVPPIFLCTTSTIFPTAARSSRWRSAILSLTKSSSNVEFMSYLYLAFENFPFVRFTRLFRLGLHVFLWKILVELHRFSGLFLQSFGYFLEGLFLENPLKIYRRSHSIPAWDYFF